MTDGVLLTGVYGTGKTSVCEEMAERLEAAGVAYAAIDLDWLGWFDVPDRNADALRRVAGANLAAVAANYLDAGVRRLVLAGAVRSLNDLDDVRGAVGVPLRVVRLVVPIDEIARRLSRDVTTGRQRDVAHARRWLAQDIGADVGDLVVANDRSVDVIATRILRWLRWI
jgi:adenylylsulfate kinase